MIQHQLLAGKRGVIFGALDESSIAWHVATQCVAEGAKITLTNAPVAMRFGTIQQLGEKLNAEVISADATSTEELTAPVSYTHLPCALPGHFYLQNASRTQRNQSSCAKCIDRQIRNYQPEPWLRRFSWSHDKAKGYHWSDTCESQWSDCWRPESHR